MILLLFFLLLPPSAQAADGSPDPDDEWIRVVDLRGAWSFRLGDDPAWREAGHEDKEWETIFVPSRWEEEGYWGYDGFAWYRKRFRLPENAADQALYIDVGRVDDVSVVYINGYYVGSAGHFPPKARTGYHAFGRYRIPVEYLQVGGINVVSVRVYDMGGEGGVVEGKPGIFAHRGELSPAIDLAGPWRFRTGDRMAWRAPALDESAWDQVTVPGQWESQGYADYDGFAWYRKTFHVPASYKGEELVVILGKIDDLDEVYLNGELIGATGRMRDEEIEGWEWQAVRTYPVPPGVLRPGGKNVLAVRVYDGLVDGGLFEGPIGIARPDDVVSGAHASERPPKRIWESIIDWFIDGER